LRRRLLFQCRQAGPHAALNHPRERAIEAICLSLEVCQHRFGDVQALLALVGRHISLRGQRPFGSAEATISPKLRQKRKVEARSPG
jgi:hypothetical protein